MVLIVDDDAMIRRLVRTVLEADDFEVHEASSGRQGLESAITYEPDLVVLDVMMPGMDGIDVCRELDHDKMKVLMLTARDDVEIEKMCRDAGADGFLTKPFSSLELLSLIDDLTLAK